MDRVPEATWGEGGLPAFLHPVWTPKWPLECRQQYACSFLIHGSSITSIAASHADLVPITGKAPSSVQDQTFGHQQRAVGYYLDQEVRFDTKACCLGRPFNEVVQKLARLASLIADASAPTELSAEQNAKLATHDKVIKLGQRNKILTERVHRAGYRSVKDAQGTALFQKKKKAEARLNTTKQRLRVKMITQGQERHFRTADTQAFDAQFAAARVASTSTRDIQHAKPIIYSIPERAKVVQLVCSPGEDISDREQFQRRIQAAEIRMALCNRREAQRRGRSKVTIKQEDSDDAMDDSKEGFKEFPTVCRPTQFPVCLSNESLPYHHRVYEYAKPHQMMDEVERHLKRFAPAHRVPCPHPQCKAICQGSWLLKITLQRCTRSSCVPRLLPFTYRSSRCRTVYILSLSMAC